MTGVHRLACQMATLLLLLTLTTLPAKAQFGGGGGGSGDMMTQMAPMLEMLKAKMGKRRFGAMMQTIGPMMSRMMENGGGGFGGGIPGGFGGGDVTSMLGSSGGGELMAMIPQVMQMANLGGGHGHRRHRRRQ